MSGLFGLSGKHALVTGASSGLGRHFAGVLADAGAVVGARRAEALAETLRIGRTRTSASPRSRRHRSCGDRAGFRRRRGAIRAVTVLINNAGVTATRAALDVDEKTWDQVIDTNLKGVWLTAQAAARRMVKNATGGSIVNIASILGLRVAGGVSPYAVSKAGVVQLTKSLALEWARHKISRQCPGARLYRDRAQRCVLCVRRRPSSRQTHSAAPARSGERTRRPGAAAGLRRQHVHDRQRGRR